MTIEEARELGTEDGARCAQMGVAFMDDRVQKVRFEALRRMVADSEIMQGTYLKRIECRIYFKEFLVAFYAHSGKF